jgi:dTDP-4-dehydrorhamnose reductase
LALRRLAGPDFQIHAPGRDLLDLGDREAIEAMVASRPWRAVISSGAYTAVDKAESEPERARQINADTVGVIATEMARLGGWLVHYSTDYVFDGMKSGSYVETDPTGPLGVYGATKLAGEQLVAASGCRHLVFRTSWVYAAHGSNFIRTILRLSQDREELSVVDDQIGAPTSAARIATITAAAIRRLAGGEEELPASGIDHLAAAGATSWHGLAQLLPGGDCQEKLGWRCDGPLRLR